MKALGLLLGILTAFLPAAAQLPALRYETSAGKETSTYQEVIAFYRQLDKQSKKLSLISRGSTDAGFPLHLALYSNDGTADPVKWHKQEKVVLFILNGIHPGEPDGIDASMLWLRDLVQGKKKIPDNIALAFVPLYNIGGALNRSEFSRVDQDGPAAFGSRGNGQNYDLNRDFIKNDSRNARSFVELFHFLQPDVFIDNHVSNGADYQHVMTLIASQHSKLGGVMGNFMNTKFEPGLYSLMKKRGYDLIPYVNAFGDTPDAGWPEFLEGPRYSSGYASLWNCFGFVPETHMLKPYKQRVEATYALMEAFADFSSANAREIKSLIRQTYETQRTAASFPVQWKLNREKWSERLFKGYKAGKKPSGVSGLPRLYYDRSQPYETTIKFYNHYDAALEITKPAAYILPQGWWKVAELLQLNRVTMIPLDKDTSIEVEYYRIESYNAAPRAFEGHHLNTNTTVSKQRKKLDFRKGDWYIPMNQRANRFLMEVLEPQAMDSYFTWNFFDPILGQKEGYSSYVFEDTAEEYLKQHPELKKALEEKRASDTGFAQSASQQLDFIFKNSPYYEPGHMRYPVYRVLQ